MFSDDEEEIKKIVTAGGEGDEAADTRDEFEKEFDKLNKLYELEHAEDPESFEVLDIKTKINKFSKAHPMDKIPTDLINEAVRWRLSQNDCQNRGYVLDGYPISFETAKGVFYVTPPKPEKKKPQLDENGEEIKEEAEEMDPEEFAKLYAPKF